MSAMYSMPLFLHFPFRLLISANVPLINSVSITPLHINEMRKLPTYRILHSAVLALFMLVQLATLVHARYLNLTVLSPQPHDLYYLGQDIHMEYVPLDNTIDQLNIYLDTFGKVTERIFVKLVADISKSPSGTSAVNGQQVPKYSYTYHIPTSLPVDDEAFQVTFETAKGEVLIPISIQRPPAASTTQSDGSSGLAYQKGNSKPTATATPMLAHATAPSTSLIQTTNTVSSISHPVNGFPISASRTKHVITIVKTIVVTTIRPKPTALPGYSSPMATYQSHYQTSSFSGAATAVSSTFVQPTHFSYISSSLSASQTVLATNSYSSSPYRSVPATSSTAPSGQPTVSPALPTSSTAQFTTSTAQTTTSSISISNTSSKSESSNVSSFASTTSATAPASESSSAIASTTQQASIPSISSTTESSTVTMSASTTPTPPDKDSFIRHSSAALINFKMHNCLSLSVSLLLTVLLIDPLL